MKISETKAEGLIREYAIVISAAEIDEQVSSKLAELATTVNMPGFRPGKVPMSVVKSRFGPQVQGEAMKNAHAHLDYIDWLAEQGNWLAGKAMSLADLSAAAHLSVTDYFGDIDWDRHPEARTWYAKIKSRPSFRDLLADVVAGLTPAAHYADLDF